MPHPTRPIKFRTFNAPGVSGMHVFTLDNEYDCETGAFGPHPLMQYTGLYDKNRKEIYEGDVLTLGKKGWDDFKVSWSNGMASYWLYSVKTGQTFWDGWFDEEKASKCEVIGNVHENKDLLNAPTTD